MVIFHSYVIIDLAGGIPIPLKKQESQWEGLSQYIVENTKCLKPPTSNYITDLTIQSRRNLWLGFCIPLGSPTDHFTISHMKTISGAVRKKNSPAHPLNGGILVF